MKTLKFAALLFAALLVLSSCSDDDGGDESSQDQTTQDESTQDGSGASGEGSDSTDGGSDESADGGSGGDLDDCEAFGDAWNDLSDEFEQAASSGDPGAVSEQLDEIADQVPDEIADDYQTVADGYAQLAALGSGENVNPADAAQAAQVFTDGDFIEASQNITTWITENCTPG